MASKNNGNGNRNNGNGILKFDSILQTELPAGRRGKHFEIVSELLSQLETLDHGRALKVPLADLPDTKANVRSALSRACKQKQMDVASASDETFLYLWKPAPDEAEQQ